MTPYDDEPTPEEKKDGNKATIVVADGAIIAIAIGFIWALYSLTH